MRTSLRPSSLPLPFLLVLAPLTGAQEPKIHTRAGDPAPGGSTVQRPLAARIDDGGAVLRLLDTNLADTSLDTVLALGDQVLLNEGMPLPSAPAFTLDTFLGLSWAPGGLATVLDLDSATSQNLTALFWNERLVELEGQPLTATGAGAKATLFSVPGLAANAEGTLMALARLDGPGLSGPLPLALLRYRFAPDSTLLSAQVVARVGDVVPVLGGPIAAFAEQGPALNRHGDFLCTVREGARRESILMNLAFVLAREGELSPLRDRRYEGLDNSRLALNDQRDYAFSALLDGVRETSALIVKNGSKFVQSGDVLPEFSSSPLQRAALLLTPLLVASSGNVFWRAASDAGDSAYMRDRQPIVRVGQTVGGMVVTSLMPEEAFSVSPDGRRWVGRVVLEGSIQALLTADLGLVTRFGGCVPNIADLSIAGGLALPGQTLVLTMTRGQATGVVPILKVATRRVGPCGVMSGAGEALLDPTSLIATYTGAAWTGAPSAFAIDVPPDLALVDQEFFAQGFFVDVGDQSPAVNVRLTNGLRIVVGAP